MSTLADIRKAADGDVWTGSGRDVPPNHFVAVARILGLSVTYLLASAPSDPNAPIVGRIEFDGSRVNAYRGSGVKGGELLFGTADRELAFQKMVEEI